MEVLCVVTTRFPFWGGRAQRRPLPQSPEPAVQGSTQCAAPSHLLLRSLSRHSRCRMRARGHCRWTLPPADNFKVVHWGCHAKKLPAVPERNVNEQHVL